MEIKGLGLKMAVKLVPVESARLVREAGTPGGPMGILLNREAKMVPAPKGVTCRCCGKKIATDDWAILYPFEELDGPAGQVKGYIHFKACSR